MKNTIAIGQPDKVSRAERDGRTKAGIFESVKIPESVKKKIDKKIRQMLDDFNTEMFTGVPVIQFDLPKGYSARDAYYSAVCHLEDMDVPKERIKGRYIAFFKFHDIVGIDLQKWWELSKEDRANFYLLLAYANGFTEL
jgi:hypothetical protein